MFKYENSETLCPTSVNTIVNYLSKIINDIPIQKNIAYAIQYMEYLDHLISKGNITSVLFTQLYKTFIICGVSVIEAFLYCLLKENKEVKLEEWKKTGDVKSFSVLNDSVKLEVCTLIKTEKPTFKELKFETIINKASKIKLLGEDKKIYLDLKKIQRLRNKIHIYNIEDLSHSDYNSFNRDDYIFMKDILYTVFGLLNKKKVDEVLGFCKV